MQNDQIWRDNTYWEEASCGAATPPSQWGGALSLRILGAANF